MERLEDLCKTELRSTIAGTAQREGLGGALAPPPHFFARIKIN